MSIRFLSPELAAKAAEELNEDPSRVMSDIETIQNWLKQQAHLSNVKISNQRILAFLRGCKFSIEKCKQKLDMYYSMKNFASEIFTNRDPFDPKIQEILKSGAILPLTDSTNPTAEKVLLMRIDTFDYSLCSITDMAKVNFMITDILMQEDDNYVVNGEILIYDLKNLSFRIISQFTPVTVKKLAFSTERSYPIREKGMHVFNFPSSLEALITLLKSFLSDKLKNRINVHSQGLEKLHEYIPKHMIPKDFGGDSQSTQEIIDFWKNKVESYRDWFLEEDKYKSDEKKRTGKPRTSEELFGIDGSFRKLNYD